MYLHRRLLLSRTATATIPGHRKILEEEAAVSCNKNIFAEKIKMAKPAVHKQKFQTFVGP